MVEKKEIHDGEMKGTVTDIPEPAMELAEQYVDFLNNSPTKYHACDNNIEKLKKAGFQELDVDDTWNLVNGGKYFINHNESCLISFVIGRNYVPGNPVAIVATHTDSPTLKIKPVSNIYKHNYALVGSSIYGGGHWHTYFDREYKLAGKVYVRDGDAIKGYLIHIDEPVLYIPNLAIHFTGWTGTFSPDLENEMLPIMCLTNDQTNGAHRDELLQLIADEVACSPSDIVELDLHVVDQNPAKLVGLKKEFIAGQNQDNLLSTFTVVEAIIRASASAKNNNANYVMMAINFDHEEVGSKSPEGAQTRFTKQVLKRIVGGPEKYAAAQENSFILSADVAHALHPNYADRWYESQNRCDMFGGIAIKYSAKLNYATNGYSTAVARQVGVLGNVPTQDFAVRNDVRSGSTLGPYLAANLGITTADVGATILAMHSIRELSGTITISQSTDYFESFFTNFAKARGNVIE